jgi:hypothetical protein
MVECESREVYIHGLFLVGCNYREGPMYWEPSNGKEVQQREERGKEALQMKVIEHL